MPRGIHVNPLAFVPMSLDYVDLRPDLMVEMVLRYRDLESTLPFNGWWSNPITTVFTVKGCAFECVTCGSSHTTCTHLTKRQKPVYRSPASLVANMQAISRLDAWADIAGRRSAHGRTRITPPKSSSA